MKEQDFILYFNQLESHINDFFVQAICREISFQIMFLTIRKRPVLIFWLVKCNRISDVVVNRLFISRLVSKLMAKVT